MTVEETMLESKSLIGAQTLLFRVTVLAGLALGGSLLLAAAITGTSLATFLYFIPAMVYTPPTYFPADQVVSPVGGLLLDPQGLVKNYTIGVAETLNETTIVAGGEAFEVTVVGDVGTIRLKDRGLAPGPHARAQWTVTDEGITTAVTASQSVDSAAVLNGASTVDDALGAEFLLLQAEASLVNARVLAHDGADFDESTATPGALSVTLAPSAVAGQNCTHITQIDFGGGTRVDACTSGTAPNTPSGRASLGTDLFVLPSQLPVVFRPDFMGLWNASSNTPFLDNAACVPTDYYYYVVKGSGNTTLGAHGVWRSKDILVCQNGTWERVADVSSGVSSIFGRTGAPTPQLGDYTSDLIPVSNGTLEDLSLAPLLVYGSAPELPNAVLLQGDAGEVNAAGGLLLLSLVSGTSTLISSSATNTVVDRHGRVRFVQDGGALIQSVNGTANQIIASGSTSVTLSLHQDIHTDANVQYASVTVGSREILASGAGTAAIPATGAADFVMTAGAQTINGATTWETVPTVRSGEALQLNNAANTGSVQLRASASAATDTKFRYPATLGSNQDALRSDGTGGTYWQAAPSADAWTLFTPSAPAVSTNIIGFVPYSGAWRGSGLDGSLTEVRLTFRVQRQTPLGAFADGWVDLAVPVGTIQNFVPNRNVGMFTRAGQSAHHGLLKMGATSDRVRASVNFQGSRTEFEYWYVEYTYILDI